MCGDSTIEEDVLKLMNGEKAVYLLNGSPILLDYFTEKEKEIYRRISDYKKGRQIFRN